MNIKPVGKVPTNSQVSISPTPLDEKVIEGNAVLFVTVVFSTGEIVIPWEMTSFTVMFSVAETEPPVLFAQMV